MAYSPHTFFGDGSTTDFVYTFDVLGSYSSVIVKTQVLGGSLTQLTRGVEYEEITPKIIRFNTGFIPAGDGTAANSTLINITRLTSRSRTVDYIGGGTIRERDLDNDMNRLLSVDEEIESGVFAALFKNDAGTAWNGEGIPSQNCGEALVVDGWATLGQVQSLVSDLNVADLSTPIINTHTGDGVETEFELNGSRGGTPGQADVYINSIYQTSDQAAGIYSLLLEGDTDYPSGGDGDDFIQFSVAPPLGAAIEIKQFTGTVLGVLPAEFVNLPTQIADNIIGLEHLEVDAGVSRRFILFDTTGQLPVARRIGIEDLLATSQALGAGVRAALTHATTGLRLSDFLRLPGAAVKMSGQKITGLGAPTASADAATKGYADGLKVQIGKGNVTAGLPNTLNATIDITVGFQADFFLAHIHHSGGPSARAGAWTSKHTWINAGPSHQETIQSAPRAFGPTGGSVTVSMMKINQQTTTKVRIENTTQNNFGTTLSTITSISWFAIKLGI